MMRPLVVFATLAIGCGTPSGSGPSTPPRPATPDAGAPPTPTETRGGYDAERDNVHAEVVTAVRQKYPRIMQTIDTGTVRTAWHPIKRDGESVEYTDIPGGESANMYFVQFEVRIVGPRPWHIEIEGQVAKWLQGGQPVPVPDPDWLEQETADLRTAIQARLKKYWVAE